MGELRDELIKKGLVSDKKAKQLAHKERARKKRLGRDGVGAERRARADELLAQQLESREQDRKREAARRNEAGERETRAAVIQLISDHARRDGVKGPRRFHFVTRSGRIPFIEVSDEVARELEHGQLTVCELPGTSPESFVLLPAKYARRVRETAPEYLLFDEG